MSLLGDSPANRERAEKLVGQVINDRYRIDAVIGIGSMGTVFRARHLGLKRDVALKILHPHFSVDREMSSRFAREAASASRLDHPNCVTVTDYGTTPGGDHYMVMQMLEGTELYELLDGPLPLPRVLDFTTQILKGLAHAHSRGIVHRDVKPENMYVTRDHEGREQIKILDFGIAKIVSGEGAKESMTRAGMVFGTPSYMSPEQATGGNVDARTDLYAVGVLMYTMLAGHLPFDDEDPVQVVRKQIKEAPPPLPGSIPAEVRAVIERLLSKDPQDRFPDAEAALAALRGTTELDLAARGRTQILGADAPAPGRSWNRWAQPSVRNLAIAGVAVLVLGGIVWAASAGDDQRNDASAAKDGPPPSWGDVWTKVSNKDPQASAAAAPGAGGSDGEAGTPADGGSGMAGRALKANLASIDALIASRKYDAARISIGPLLEVYPDEPQLHWRMGKVTFAEGGKGSAAVALDSYAAAVDLDPDLLEDVAFREEFDALMNKPEVRNKAVDLAIEKLGDEGHDLLLAWLNVDATPLPYEQRHRVIAHLEQDPDTRARINRPLQYALDLWQASDAAEPCEAFESTLEAIEVDPDSYLVGTLHAVAVPGTEGEGADAGPACEKARTTLERVRTQHDGMFQGIDATVPRAYRKRKATGGGGNSRRRRRR